MSSPSSKFCPKCGKPFIEKRNFNSNYDIYIHKRQPGSVGLLNLIYYCIVVIGYDYKTKHEQIKLTPLNPEYKPSMPKF